MPEDIFAPGIDIKHGADPVARVIDVVCAIVTGALLALTLVGWVGLARVMLTFAFAVYVPGWAVVSNCTQKLRDSRIALAVVVSLALLTAGATVTLWLHAWHPLQLFDAEAGASVALIGFAAIRREGRQPRNESHLQNVVPGEDE